jgi:hypothetical protein
MYPAPPVIRIAIAIRPRRPDLKLGTKFPSVVLSKPLPRTTLEVRWGSFPIKRFSRVPPDAMQAAVSATCLRLDPPPELLVQPQLANQIASSGWQFRRANFHHIPGGISALSCNQLRTMHGA